MGPIPSLLSIGQTTPMMPFLNAMPLLHLPWLWTYCDAHWPGPLSPLATQFEPSPFFLVVGSDGLVHWLLYSYCLSLEVVFARTANRWMDGQMDGWMDGWADFVFPMLLPVSQSVPP